MLLPTSVVGSHGLPGWVWLAREAMEAGRLGALDVRELMEDATQAALLDQERAGVDVLTTGEMMRVRFIIGFYDRISGIRPLPAARKLGQPLWDTNTPFEVTESISAPAGLGIVEEFKLARALTSARLKATVPGPYTLLSAPQAGGRLQGQGDAAGRPGRHRERRVPGPGRGGRRLHPDRRAAQRDVRRLGPALRAGREPGRRGRRGEDRRARLLRQPLRAAVLGGARFPESVPGAARAPRVPDRPRVRQPRDGRSAPLAGVPDRQGAGRRRHRRQGVQGRVGGRRGRADPRDLEARAAREAVAQSRLRILGNAALGGEAEARRARRGTRIVRRELGG